MTRKRRVAALACAGLLMFGGACGGDDAEEPTTATEDDASGCEEGVVTTDSGLNFEDTVCGEGDEAASGDVVSVHYTGTLEDGTEFDSSVDRGPFSVRLGAGDVIAGWDEGIPGMKVGGTRILTIPPDLAYGEGGYPPVIPPNSTLIFEIELLEIQPAE
ncbi:MAG TPA: FKBP-type peptidyl-prolyl cis-trans isomerase [Actinomycetota bacterium]|nr:FKBP-type peptidyl-prolyl cis-trans isomerase [Actinomycetota bacterium]